MIRQGIDPVERRREISAALAGKLAEFHNEKHRKQWRATLDRYAVPEVGDLPVAEIGIADVLRILEPIWSSKVETASRLRGRIEAVLAWATVAGHRAGDNPARWKGNLDAVLPKPGRLARVQHFPALALDEAPDWFADVRARSGFATRALEFMALTAARSGEVRGAQWAELDLEARLWTIPADRMKARKEHRIPLAQDAMTLLQNLDPIADSPFVFPALRGGMLSDAALSACMKRVHEAREDGAYLDRRTRRPAVPHGLRSTFRDWAAERTEYPRDMAETALAHIVGTEVERAYRRSDMLEKRRQMMAAWGQYLAGDSAPDVVRLHGSTRTQADPGNRNAG